MTQPERWGEKEAQKNTVFNISGYILIHRAQRKRGGKKTFSFSSTSKVPTEKEFGTIGQSPFDSTQITRTRATFLLCFSLLFFSPPSLLFAAKARPIDKLRFRIEKSSQAKKTNSMLGIVFSDP